MEDLNFDFVEEGATVAERVDETASRNLNATGSNDGQTQNASVVAPVLPTATVAGGNQGPFLMQHDRRNDQKMAEIQRERALAANSQHVMLVSKRQEKNPLLKFIRNVRWQFGDIVPDYMLGKDTCALFLSLRYYLLEPEYIYGRIAQLQRSFRVRVLLCHVDVPDVVKPLGEVTKIAIFHDWTLICAWSYKECARYLETFKSYETKPADGIKERVDNDFSSRLTAALTAIKGVNKTDSAMLGSSLGSFAAIMKASKEDISACPGIGPTKLQRLHDTFHQPFYFGRGASNHDCPSSQHPNAVENISKAKSDPQEGIPQAGPAARQLPGSRKRGRSENVEKEQDAAGTNEAASEKSAPSNEKEVVQDVGIPLDIEEF
ncbi:hypothetical protein BSKO_10314 [Bryopsis sp. KO-2023]|nr:hypothetical protein BSKO_10314 [Bryopsis sp. KO-2023]